MRLLIRIPIVLILSIVMFCGVQFIRTKYVIAKLPFTDVVRYCSGQTTMDSVCECYNYYGRQCLSRKRLVWDWVPGDADSEAEHATPQKLKDLIEEELYTNEENV